MSAMKRWWLRGLYSPSCLLHWSASFLYKSFEVLGWQSSVENSCEFRTLPSSSMARFMISIPVMYVLTQHGQRLKSREWKDFVGMSQVLSIILAKFSKLDFIDLSLICRIAGISRFNGTRSAVKMRSRAPPMQKTHLVETGPEGSKDEGS